MRSVLTREIPEFAAGQLTLTGCAIKRLRSGEIEGHWTGTYLLTVAGDGFGDGQTVATRGELFPPGAPTPPAPAGLPFAADGWSCFLPDLRLQLRMDGADLALPAVELLLDPSDSPALMQDALRRSSGDLHDAVVAKVETEILEDKPGVRCTLRCRVHYAEPYPVVDRRRADLVIAKVHVGDEGAHIHDVMQALQDSPFGESRHVAVAEPLAYLPELRLLVQSAVPEEQTLKDLVHLASQPDAPATAGAELEEALRRTARGLADLHGSGISQGSVVTFADELAILRRKQEKLAAVVPRLGDVGATALDRLSRVDSESEPDPTVPVHHSFRPSQVLIAGDQMSFIDFDKLCWSEAASDLAMFTTKLRHMSMNKVRGQFDDRQPAEQEPVHGEERNVRIDTADRLCEIFVTEYSEHSHVSRTRLALWEALELYSLVLSAAKKTNAGWIDSCASMLARHLRMHAI